MNAKSWNTLILDVKTEQPAKTHQVDICKFYLINLGCIFECIFSINNYSVYNNKIFFTFCVRCHCAPNFHGIHCATRSNDCTSGSNQELCGHGSCISNDQNGYECICEQVNLVNHMTIAGINCCFCIPKLYLTLYCTI